MSKEQIDDDLLTQYLLGSLGDEDAERLDEMSVTDDDVAWRLRAVENDLVDNYVRGEMSEDTEKRFRESYLASPHRRQKVMIAKALRSREFPPVSRFAVPRLRSWAIAASLVAIFLLAYALSRPRGTERVPDEFAAGSTMVATTATSPAISSPAAVVSVLLSPPTRGTGTTPTVSIPPGTDAVNLKLELEADDFPEYQGTLRDLVTNEIVWRSKPTKSEAVSVPIDVPANVFKQQNYTLELSGLPAGRPAELIGGYAFRVTLH